MKTVKRYLQPFIKKDIEKKMVFLYGPRQVGKTTLALSLLKKGGETHPAYFNWDAVEDRKNLLKGHFPPREKLLIFDEIHKYSRWRNFLKGLYDKQKSQRQFLITGSGSLKHYARGGDSLSGRYFSFRLHPFSLRELNQKPSKEDLKTLLNMGGFPEPLFSDSMVFLRRWRNERVQQLIREDVRDLERVRELDIMEILADTLSSKVGAPLSIKALKEDLQLSHETVERWISILESLFVCFRIPPFGAAKIRAVKKEKKLYLYDWTSIASSGARFENLVACQLLKYCHFIEDTQGFKMELRFLRDTDKRGLDFVVLKEKKPLFALECKSGDRTPSSAIHYFKQRTNIPLFYQTHLRQADYETESCRVLPFETFCQELNMP